MSIRIAEKWVHWGVSQESLTNFTEEMDDIEQRIDAYVREVLSGHFPAARLESFYEKELCWGLGINSLEDVDTLNIREDLPKLCKYVWNMVSSLEESAQTPLEKERLVGLRLAVEKATKELQLLDEEAEKSIKNGTLLFKDACVKLFADIRSFLQEEHSSQKVKEKLPVYLSRMDQIMQEIRANTKQHQPYIQEFSNQWQQRALAFAPQFIHMNTAEQTLLKLKQQQQSFATVELEDLITNTKLSFSGYLMEVEQRLQWMNAFYIVINEIQTLYLMVVNDGLLSAPARLLREQKVALEVILKELK